MPVAPATWASLVVAVLAYLGAPALSGSVGQKPYGLPLVVLGVAVAGFGLRFADEAERELGHDAHPIVIDEVAGQLLALAFLPHTVQATAIAFLLFRVFDVVKVEPANRAQRLPGGLGIMADDLVAGVYACLASHVVLALLVLVRRH
jgi:phosphatidylglycerophosphatase A